MTPIDLQRWQWLGFALLVGFLLWLLGPILTPFVISALLGWLGDPLVDRLERSGRSRSISVVIVFVLMTGLLGLALLVVLPLLSAALVSRTRYKLASARGMRPTRVAVDQPATSVVRVENVSRLPSGLLLVEDSVP